MKNLNLRLRLSVLLMALGVGGLIHLLFPQNMVAQFLNGEIVGAAWAFTVWYKTDKKWMTD